MQVRPRLLSKGVSTSHFCLMQPVSGFQLLAARGVRSTGGFIPVHAV